MGEGCAPEAAPKHVTCATLPPLGLKKKFEILVKLHANLKKREPKNGKSGNSSIHSSILWGLGFRTFRGCHATPLTLGVRCVTPKNQGARGMASDWADFGYLQNRRMSRGLACFRVCGSMRSANSIGFLRGFATFRKARKGLV